MEDWKPKEISGLDLEIYSVSLNGSSMDDITSGENGKQIKKFDDKTL